MTYSQTNAAAKLHQKLISNVGDTACDRRMDGLSHTSPDFIVLFWQTMAHRTSPLTTQHYIQAMCNRETDGSALISTCWQCFSSHINTGSVHGCAHLWVCMHVQGMQSCVLVHAILTGSSGFRCCHCSSTVILRFTLMQGPHWLTQT